MTVSKTRAVLAAFMLASSVFAITAASAQDDRQISDGDGSRVGRPKPAAKASAAPTLSSAVAKSLTTAQTNMAAKKWPEALAATKDAMAAAKTDYEKMKINQFQASILNNTGDIAGATAAAEAAADTPADAIPAEDKMQV